MTTVRMDCDTSGEVSLVSLSLTQLHTVSWHNTVSRDRSVVVSFIVACARLLSQH